MFDLLRLLLGLLVRLFHSRKSLLIENLALRQQLAVFKRKHSRPRLEAGDKLFWVGLRRFWLSWKNPLNCGHARYRGPVAPRWFQALLAASFQSAKAAGQETRQKGGPRVDLPNGCGEYDLAGVLLILGFEWP